MDSYIFDLLETHDFENIYFCQEKMLGLKAIIAIHETTLGPAAGGIRMWPYESEADTWLLIAYYAKQSMVRYQWFRLSRANKNIGDNA